MAVQVLDREAIFAALFARLQDKLAGPVVYFTRRFEGWATTQLQPALILESDKQIPSSSPGQPTIWTLTAKVGIYAEAMAADASPETALHALTQAVEAALLRDVSEARSIDGDDVETSLGGLVTSCQIAGVETEQGVEGGQGVVWITIRMVASQRP
jgi:hypothetical protein